MRVGRSHGNELCDHGPADALEYDGGLASGLALELLHGVVVLGGVDDKVGADFAGALHAGGHHLADGEIADTEKLCPLGDRQTDHAGSDNQHAGTTLDMGRAPGVEADRERLDGGGVLVGDVVGDLDGKARHAGAVLGVGAGHAGVEALGDDLRALGVEAGGALGADAAGARGDGGEAVANGPAGDARADLGDLACVLMSEHVAGLQQAGHFDRVQVGAADAASQYLEDEPAGRGDGLFDFSEFERLAEFDELQCFHGGFLLVC